MVETLSVNILIGNNFMLKYVTSIYTTERWFKPLSSRRIAIHLTEGSDKLVLATTSGEGKEKRRDSDYIHKSVMKSTAKLRYAKQTSIKPGSMKKELVISIGRGLTYFEKDEHSPRREQLMFTKGTTEILPNHLFYILIGNSINAEIHNPEHMVISQ